MDLILNCYFNHQQSIKSGLSFEYKNYSHLQQDVRFGTDINPIGPITSTDIKTKISFVELQLHLIYQLEIKENKFFFAGGVEMSYPFVIKGNREYMYGNGDHESQKIDKNYSKLLINFQTSFGFRFKIGQNHNFAVEPIFKYYLNDLIIISSRIINYGIKTSYFF